MLQKLQNFRSWLLPRLCVCCGFQSYEPQLDLCSYCRANLPWLVDACYQCGVSLKVTESIICEQCASSAPPFNRVCALFKYQQPIIKLIGSLKFGQQLYPGALLGNLLCDEIKRNWYLNKDLVQVILPMPLHVSRHRKRGYNQAVELARPLAKALDLPLDQYMCERVKNTKAQAKLNKEQRYLNLQTAFAINMKQRYKHVAIVDDVITTGSTVRALSNALRAAGVDQIDVWCVARA